MPSTDGAEGPPEDGNMQTLRLSDFLPSPYVQKRQQNMVNNGPWPIVENPESGTFPPVPPLPNNGSSPTFLVFDPAAMGFGGDGCSPTFGGQMWQPDDFSMTAFAMGEDMGMGGDIPCTPCPGPNGMDWPTPQVPVMGNSNGINNNGMNNSGMSNNSSSNNGMNSNVMNNNGSSNSNGNNNSFAMGATTSQQNIFDILSAAAPNSKISIRSSSNSQNNGGMASGNSGGQDSARTLRTPNKSHGSSHRRQGNLGSDGPSHDRSSGNSNSTQKWRKNRGNHGRH
jgi:hypothetical protein